MLRRSRLIASAVLALGLGACGHVPNPLRLYDRGPDIYPVAGGAPGQVARSFQDIGYADWSEYEPPYRFYPGDAVEVIVPSAPELNREVIVQPDGRVTMPLIEPVMAADRTVSELRAALSAAYAGELLRPDVTLTIKSTTPLKVFVMGEVATPGVYDMPGDINALQAVAQAGGFKTTANRSEVVVIRRGPQGRAMVRTADLLKGLRQPGTTDLVPLRRFDIVYVPRSGVAEAGLFVQQYFRDLSPIQFGFNYAIGGNGY